MTGAVSASRCSARAPCRGPRRAAPAVEQITGDEREVDLVRLGDPGDLIEDVSELLRAVVAPEPTADVPVRRVEDLHAQGRGPLLGEPVERVASGVVRHLLLPGGPRREGERHDQRDRDRRLPPPTIVPG